MTNGFKPWIHLSFLFFLEEAQEISTIVGNAIFAVFPWGSENIWTSNSQNSTSSVLWVQHLERPNWELINYWTSELYSKKDFTFGFAGYFLTILFSLIGNRCVEWGVDFKGNDVALKKGILHWEECANLCQGFMKLNLIKYCRYSNCFELKFFFFKKTVQ